MLHDSVTPYQNKETEKKEQVAQMFDNIANRYDVLNSVLSLGIHKGWRKKSVKILSETNPQLILDVATGTGDFAIECAKLNPEKIIGVDISEGMMIVGREKLKQLNLNNIELQYGNAETLSFNENYFDGIVVGFGVRNFQNLEKGLSNLYRILKPGGQLIILEFSYPTNIFVKAFYTFYLSVITPLIGKLFSKDKRAYSYLAESVKAFPHNQQFINELNKNKYQKTYFKKLFFGIAAIYVAKK
ncbi:MAG: bifunctional demethylmenaquinone methyltransferase/2-methoxy-6-polyprenyl-1,4-benzoquinol methylase UbiE [Bacteroidetes bacterium]|nr:bifunctional demethylmenaquinone methyltransferase/2-methoxy-6-polyprenyl-1,4-benzoquinol methylase UbiE [Bacteroidota bacterium]